MPTKKTKRKGVDEPEPWGDSAAKAHLRAAIVAGKIPATWEPKRVYELHWLYQLYDYSLFRTNLKNLRNLIAADYVRSQQDLEAYMHDDLLMKSLGKKNVNPEYPNWHQHEARHLLRKDIEDGKHKSMKPKELWVTQVEYLDFPLDVFRNHLYTERDKPDSQAARYQKKQLRSMALEPRQTVLTTEEQDTLIETKDDNYGGDVPDRFCTKDLLKAKMDRKKNEIKEKAAAMAALKKSKPKKTTAPKSKRPARQAEAATAKEGETNKTAAKANSKLEERKQKIRSRLNNK